MTNAVINNKSQIFAKHQTNISASLIHRLDVAKANQNSRLLALLEQEQIEQEQKQLTKISTTQLPKHFWNWLSRPTQPSVKEVVGAVGGKIWQAYNPRTGETRYAQTEAEIIDWLESNHWCH